MIGWIIYNKDDYEKNKFYCDMNIRYCAKKGVTLILKFMELFSYGIKNNVHYIEYDNCNIEKPKFVIARMRNSMFTKHLELMGIDVYNNSFVSYICNNKANTYNYLANSDINIIDTEFIYNTEYNYKLNDLGYYDKNKVIKSCFGHGGLQVYRGDKYIKDSCNKDIVVQPLIKGNKQDLRVYVLDNEIIAAVLRTGQDDFRSNYSLGGQVKLYTLSNEECDIVYSIINKFNNETYIRTNSKGLFYVGIDFIIDKDNMLLFNEIEDVVGSRMLYETSDIDIVGLYIDKIIAKY